MFLYDSTWIQICTQFSEDEHTQLAAAVKGRVHSPAGVQLDVEKLGRPLTEKLTRAMVAHHKAQAQQAGR